MFYELSLVIIISGCIGSASLAIALLAFETVVLHGIFQIEIEGEKSNSLSVPTTSGNELDKLSYFRSSLRIVRCRDIVILTE